MAHAREAVKYWIENVHHPKGWTSLEDAERKGYLKFIIMEISALARTAVQLWSVHKETLFSSVLMKVSGVADLVDVIWHSN